MDITGNKGEWSEVYVLFKLLADGNLSAGDADMNKIEGLLYPIISVIRDNVIYNRGIENVILKSSDGETISTIPVIEFERNARILLDKIRSGKNAFPVPEINDFRKKSNVENIKAPSKEKADIILIVHDERTGFNPTLGFSIKSQLGSPSTLLNAGRNTNFIYSLSRQLDEELIEIINNTPGQAERMTIINLNHVVLHYVGIQSPDGKPSIFEYNLINMDTCMPLLVSYMIYYYQLFGISGIKELCDKLKEENPLKFDLSYHHTYYETKIKRLLVDTALGMTPSVVWNGKYEANGGYLVVKEDGEIVCYHIYNKNDFEDYLFHNTKLESASRSRHDYGYIYSKDGHQYIKLNLQIRFKK